jgi:hypothetical protein
MICFDGIIEHILSLNEPNTIVYIAVGSCAGSIEHDEITNSWKIKPELEQQFPPFLSTLKQRNCILPTHIILIDSLLEDPPFVMCNSKKQVSDDWCSNDIWKYNIVTNTYVYPVRVNVTYPPYNEESQINIDIFLQQLNLCAIENNWFVVFHDFCGRDVGPLAEHFDCMLKGHLDHIIYGIGARSDGGCFLDLTLPECQFEYIISDDGIKTFNPYQYTLNELVPIYNGTDSIIIKQQIKVMFENIKRFFKTTFFNLIRQLAMLDCGKEVTLYEYSYSHFASIYNIKIKEHLENKKYKELLNILVNMMEIELSKHFENTIVNSAIINMLNEPNFYKWSDHLEEVFNEVLFL